MTPRVLALAWVAIGVVVWNVIFDRYVAEGAREYLQVVAEVRAGYGVERTMLDIMTWWTRTGAVEASIWATFVVAAGWATIWLARRPARQRA